MSSMNNFIHEYKCVIAIVQNIGRVRKVESLAWCWLTMEPRLKPRATILLHSQSLPGNAWPHWWQAQLSLLWLLIYWRNSKYHSAHFEKLSKTLNIWVSECIQPEALSIIMIFLYISRKNDVLYTMEIYAVVKKNKVRNLQENGYEQLHSVW